MAKKPNVPCAGTCGRLIWSGRGCLPPGQAMCRECRRTLPKPDRPDAECEHCGAAFTSVRRSNGQRTKTCGKSCAQQMRQREMGVPPGGDPEKRKARGRAKTHLRKTVGRYTDITPEYESALRAKAKRCPLCKVKLIKEPYMPASKELDHIVPLNPGCGGTHTVGNVRIICRACNRARPTDGSDYSGPVTLWAEQPGLIAKVTSARKIAPDGSTQPRTPLAQVPCVDCGDAASPTTQRCDECWVEISESSVA